VGLVKALSRWFGRGGSKASEDEAALLHRCRGDHELANRLIGYELARRPSASRASASKAALERWQRER